MVHIIYCGVPEAIANGFIANNESKPVTYGSKTTYKCYPGFQMEGSATVTCRDTGKWSTPPTCKTSVCSAADEVTHAVKKTVTGDGTSAGSIVNYTCNSGYELKGPLQILCQSNTNWSHPAPTCTKIMCPSPSIMNGDLSPKQPVMFEDTVTLTCKAGFVITNETTNTASLRCQASGKLEELSCEEIFVWDKHLSDGTNKTNKWMWRIDVEC
ncbi:sushi, von Willebrand factor type A, EGF and pentraxin domain-containing protein 1-like [Gigantopelta aegis]|uniref:sushi, von Willebrand factor type A, EGF and pentraxin domain-containing protein 1-like n=1 Tax=Gigantopelta aegis TaxID=1735272 RepID=UPI001B888F6E|nr:sushi, von Willebrand factor type A, EGF and pentraxin domain-containing protein 1-like [Gigantopelta aegis]